MRVLLVFLYFLTTGCTSLLIHQDDSTSVAAAKATWRAVLGVSTLGLSEVRMSALRDVANAEVVADERLQDYEWHLTYLVNNGALTQSEAEDLYQKYAALVWQENSVLVAGVEPVDHGYPSYGYGSFGNGLWSGSVPWYGTASSSQFMRGAAGVVGQPTSGRQWTPHDNFARLSAIARARANTTRWSKFNGVGRGYYFRGSGSKGSGRRGGGRR